MDWKDPGVIIVIFAIVLFYVRVALIYLRKTRLKTDYNAAIAKNKQNKNLKKPKKPASGIQVGSWLLVGLGTIVIILGGFARESFLLPDTPEVKGSWWIAITFGLLMLALGIH